MKRHHQLQADYFQRQIKTLMKHQAPLCIYSRVKAIWLKFLDRPVNYPTPFWPFPSIINMQPFLYKKTLYPQGSSL
jgi:hypothetical protein